MNIVEYEIWGCGLEIGDLGMGIGDLGVDSNENLRKSHS